MDDFIRPYLILTKLLFDTVLYECKYFYTCLFSIKWTFSISNVSRTRSENNRCLWYKDKLNTSSLELTNKKLHWIIVFVPSRTLRFLDYDIFQGFFISFNENLCSLYKRLLQKVWFKHKEFIASYIEYYQI